MKKNLITNPFVIYSLTWTMVVLVYLLGWSTLFPPLGESILVFLASTIVLSAIAGALTHSKSIFFYTPLKSINFQTFKQRLALSYGLIFIEILRARTVPIVSYLMGQDEESYKHFGLPFVHVTLVNFFSFLFLYGFHAYISSTDRAVRKRLRGYLILAILPAFLMFNRGMLMACSFGAMIIYLMSVKNAVKPLLRVAVIVLAILFGFGALGDLRTDTKGVKNVILIIGKATPEFESSHIPSEMFWGYIYIASPLANLQNTIRELPNIGFDSSQVVPYVLNELTPDLISNRIGIFFPYEKKEGRLIVEHFNVATVYAGGYAYLGWWGMIVTFCFMFVFVLGTMVMIPKSSPYYVSGIAIISTVILLNLFSNMFTFLGIIPQLIFPILLSLREGYWRPQRPS